MPWPGRATRATTVLLALLLTGCTAVVRHDAPAAPHDGTLALLWTRTSAEHRALFLQIFDHAASRLSELRPRAKRASWGVILDVDETIFDDSDFRLWRLGHPYEEGAFEEWCTHERARALPGAQRFLDYVHALGGRIVLVTNRSERVCEHTRANLRRENLRYDALLCRRSSKDKNERFLAVQSGREPSPLPPLEIVMWLGDNIEDFPNLKQAHLHDPNDPVFARFGRDFFVLPNPVYGSWLKNPMR